MNRVLTRDQLKVARAIRTKIEKQFPDESYNSLVDRVKKQYEEDGNPFILWEDEDRRLIFASSKEFADYWRKSEAPISNMRKQYAACALTGLLAYRQQRYGGETGNEPRVMAEEAFRYADAMVEEEARTPTTEEGNP